jgi:hypothetical protein
MTLILTPLIFFATSVSTAYSQQPQGRPRPYSKELKVELTYGDDEDPPVIRVGAGVTTLVHFPKNTEIKGCGNAPNGYVWQWPLEDKSTKEPMFRDKVVFFAKDPSEMGRTSHPPSNINCFLGDDKTVVTLELVFDQENYNQRVYLSRSDNRALNGSIIGDYISLADASKRIRPKKLETKKPENNPTPQPIRDDKWDSILQYVKLNGRIPTGEKI